jgi:hypothetical protein
MNNKDLNSPISILTEPQHEKSLINRLVCVIQYKIILKFIFDRIFRSAYGGHYGVTRSLLSGLTNLDHGFNYNPPAHLLNKTCLVLSGIDTLRYAIDQKKMGNIELLVAGPNVITIPSEADSLIASEEVDVCLVPSMWVKELYATISPVLKNRLAIWQAGVDANYWYPSVPFQEINRDKNEYLLYIKGVEGERLAKEYIGLFDRIGATYKVVTYGKYSLAQYKALLSKSTLMIVLGGTESQGLAFAEAWAMNVPTLIYFVDSWKSPDGNNYRAEAAPYLSSQTGAYFRGTPDLTDLLENIRSNKLKYSPREWVLRHMTDEFCAKLLLDKIQQIKG